VAWWRLRARARAPHGRLREGAAWPVAFSTLAARLLPNGRSSTDVAVRLHPPGGLHPSGVAWLHDLLGGGQTRLEAGRIWSVCFQPRRGGRDPVKQWA
jgi:hypothetical protein